MANIICNMCNNVKEYICRQDYKRVSIWHVNDYNIALYIYNKYMTVYSMH